MIEEEKAADARKEKVNYHARIRMQDLHEHILKHLRGQYPTNLSNEDYYKIANSAVDQILALGETQEVHQSMNL